MNKRFLFLLFSFFVGLHVSGQSDWPPVYEIKVDTGRVVLDDKYWQMLEDTAGNQNINDVVRTPFKENFHINNSASAGIGYSGVKHYWQRFRLKNLTGKDQKLIFNNTPRIMRFDLYVFRSDGRVEHLKNGWGVPTSKRDSFKSRLSVPVILADGEQIEVYKEMSLFTNEFLNNLQVGFTFYEPFIKTAYISEGPFEGDIRGGFIAGMMVLGFFLNLFFYFIVKEKVYFWFAVLLLLEGIWYLLISASFAFREEPLVKEHFQLAFTHSAFFFSVAQFVRYFLKTYKYYPGWDKFLLMGIIAAILGPWCILFISHNIPYTLKGIPGAIESLLFISTMLALLITFFFPKKEKDQFTTLSVVAAAPAFFVWSFVYGTGRLFRFLEIRYDFSRPAFDLWLGENEGLIELLAVGWFTIVFTWILLQRYAQLRKKYTLQALERERERAELMNKQKEELEQQVNERTADLKRSLDDLKATQQQLIQSEKMASLGELTAGIAHEIQNPLNFINNFSEVSSELADELMKEIRDGNLEDTVQITSDLKQNLEKIVHHGRRADSIVKNMLQHSRQSTGEKQPTAINALVDECLRLSYHGLRAKDKSFNAGMETHFDESIGKIDVVSQDIGRVLLNLFNNSFYSVMQKKKQRENGYDPTVIVSTKHLNDKVLIDIRDNGLGIPKHVLDKIYQPFFTTKPSGEGTGLGLSMSYEIITKGHGGTLTAETVEGEYAAFRIALPVKN